MKEPTEPWSLGAELASVWRQEWDQEGQNVVTAASFPWAWPPGSGTRRPLPAPPTERLLLRSVRLKPAIGVSTSTTFFSRLKRVLLHAVLLGWAGPVHDGAWRVSPNRHRSRALFTGVADSDPPTSCQGAPSGGDRQGQAPRDRGPVAGAGAHFEATAERLHAVRHTLQPRSVPVRAGIEAGAVVGDVKGQASVACDQAHGDASRAGVLRGVLQRLQRAEVHGGLQLLGV